MASNFLVDGNISYDEFLKDYLLPNRPCLLSDSLVSSWPCFRKWVQSSGPNIPDWNYLSNTYGSQEVAVADCNTREFSDQQRRSMSVTQAIQTFEDPQGALPYIKDWHLILQSRRIEGPDDREPYTTPPIFQDDWLNDSFSAGDDFRFCYAGVAGTFTPLHHDVYTSYSWSTNVVGVKIWRLFPPDIAPLLRRDQSNRRSECIFDVRNVDVSLFPRWPEAEKKMIVIQQNAGETIFVPSNWHHQVENVTDCISLNHNWCNSVNLPSLYDAMKDEAEDVASAISDVREMMQEAATAAKETTVNQKEGIQKEGENPLNGIGIAANDWRVDWLREVDKLIKMDAGWGFEDFFRMIEYNVRPSPPDNIAAPTDLRPSTAFIHKRVHNIIEDFVLRDEYSLIPDVRQVVDQIRKHIVPQ